MGIEFGAPIPHSASSHSTSLICSSLTKLQEANFGLIVLVPISSDELKQVMSALSPGLTEEDLEEMVKEVDQDGDGEVSFEGVYQLRTFLEYS